MSFFYSDVLANAAEAKTDSPISMMLILGLLVLSYFLLLRPQLKRAKEQRQVLDSLAVGDAVVTVGGITGKITALESHQLKLEIASGVIIHVQKQAVSRLLPKDSLKFE
jgi:preprotein translocase subunit YajC